MNVMTCCSLLHPEQLHSFRFVTLYAAIIDLLFGCLLLVYQYIEQLRVLTYLLYNDRCARACVVRMMIGGRLSV